MDLLIHYGEPVLWTVGAITALITFSKLVKNLRICSLMKDLFALPLEFSTHMKESNKILNDLKVQTEKMKASQSLNDNATMCLLRGSILRMHKNLEEKGPLTYEEYELVIGMYEAYKDLGGNSFIDRLMEDFHNSDS